jgi:hypothetical protein
MAPGHPVRAPHSAAVRRRSPFRDAPRRVTGVPALGALAIAAYARGGRPARALLVLPLLVLAALHVGVAGELSVLTLVMLSCVALGSLLAALVIAALLVAILDLVLLHAGGIRIATAALLDARAGRMPDFAQPVLGRMTIGYGDFFVAALAGAIASRRPSRQTLVALATTAFALAQYALSSVGGLLPAAVPVAVALAMAAIVGRLRRGRVAAKPAI